MRDLVSRALARLRQEAGVTRPSRDDVVDVEIPDGRTVFCPSDAVDPTDTNGPGVTGDSWIVAEPEDAFDPREVR